MENVLAVNSPSSEEFRSFLVHQNLLYQLIHNQGQSEVEAIREMIQNSMDAQASYCKIWLTSKDSVLKKMAMFFNQGKLFFALLKNLTSHMSQ